MYLLDSDLLSLIDRGGAEGLRIQDRLQHLPDGQISLCIVTYEEQVRGWMAQIAKAHSVTAQKRWYAELDHLRDAYCNLPVLPFDDAAIAQFQGLWIQRLRIGTMDLKIAAIALANNATLLTRNISDFGKVPGLRVEDWSA